MSDPDAAETVDTEPAAANAGDGPDAGDGSDRVDPARRDRRSPSWWAVAGLVALVAARGAVHAWQGARLILDDFSILYYAQFDFWRSLSPEFRTSRPGAWLILTVVYGVVGSHPLVFLTIVTVLNALFAVLVYLVAARYVPTAAAVAVPAVWVLMASHASLTVWAATLPALAALCLLAGGTLALQRNRWIVATLLLCAGALTYELVLPAAGVAVLLVGDHQAVRWSRRAVMVVALGLVGAWISTHSIYPVEPEVPPLSELWDSLVGRGIVGTEDPAVWLRLGLEWLTLGGAVVALVAFLRGERSPDRGPWLVLVGAALVVLGASAWVNLHALEVPLGQSDRVNAVSALGVAAIWVGIAQFLWTRDRRGLQVATVVAAVALCGVAAVGHVATMASWSRAGDDVAALFRYLEAEFELPDSRDFVVGPDLATITHGGVAALGTEGFADAARGLTIGDGPGSVTLALGPAEFTDRPGTLIDWADALGGPPYDYELWAGGSPVGEARATPEGQTIIYEGWAYDSSAPLDPVTVELRFDSEILEVPADQPSPDWATAPAGAGANHGFRTQVEVDGFLNMACVVARNIGPGVSRPLPIEGPPDQPRSTYCVGIPD